MPLQKRCILVRAVIEAADLAAAQPALTEMLRVLNVYGTGTLESAEPYWKLPGTFMVLFLLVPNDDVYLLYERLVATLAPLDEWYRSGTDDDPSAVWNWTNHASMRIERLRWLSVELWRCP